MTRSFVRTGLRRFDTDPETNQRGYFFGVSAAAFGTRPIR
jgi:hypothetical protein